MRILRHPIYLALQNKFHKKGHNYENQYAGHQY
jgi:hypothetical protein